MSTQSQSLVPGRCYIVDVGSTAWLKIGGTDLELRLKDLNLAEDDLAALRQATEARISTPADLPPKIVAAIQDVVNYNWASELADYEQQDDDGRAAHVFLPLTTLAKWLDQLPPEEAAVAGGARSPAWGEAAEAFDKAFNHLDSVERSLGELIEDPSSGHGEVHEMRGTLMAGIRVLRRVADTVSDKAHPG